jgi:ferredoxin
VGACGPEGLERLVEVLRDDGWEVLGPQVRDGVIAWATLAGAGDLPTGVTAEQAPGRYRLRARADRARFGWAVGPGSPKRELFPPRSRLWSAGRDAHGAPQAVPAPAPRRPVAFLGARPCELAGIAVQDRVFCAGPDPDPDYTARRAQVLTVVVHCTEPGGTCFCASMDTGPAAAGGYDLALTELVPPPRPGGGSAGDPPPDPVYLVRVGSEAGAAIAVRLPLRPLPDGALAAERAALAEAQGRMGRHLRTEGIVELLAATLEHPRWDDVAARCLACTNCTLVCPTCFCHAVEEVTDLTGGIRRERRWDSCFTLGHSELHGGSVRATVRSRYRQWLTHKLGTWWAQFGTSGCVGCGRCITWCPVGIDLTEEVAALAAPPGDAGGGAR